MNDLVAIPAGGFAYLPGGTHPFSNGVVALEGHHLTRVRLRAPLPLAEGMALAAAHIAAQNRPGSAFAACELRSPAPLTRADFAGFNAQYAGLLQTNGFGAEVAHPIARSNLAPIFDPPAETTLFAFTYAVPGAAGPGPDFVVSGKPENTDASPGIIAPGAVSAAGMVAKAHYVIDQLRQRVAELGGRWADITGAQAYTIQSLDPLMDLLRTSGLAGVGFTLFPAYPPMLGLDFEIDVRAVTLERVI